MPRDRIILDSDAKLKIYMFPLRQQIIRELSQKGRPMTAKQLADKLEITPSSAKHHLEKLKSIGIVEFDHSEMIHGIQANYYLLTNAIISIGQNQPDDYGSERDAFVLKEMSEASVNYQSVIRRYRSGPLPDNPLADMFTGIAHLSDEQVRELMKMIEVFMEDHAYQGTQEGHPTHPWEYLLVCYRKDLAVPEK